MKFKQKKEIIEENNEIDFAQVSNGFNFSATKAIIKQDVMPYKCSHIHGKEDQIIEKRTDENSQMFNSASVTTRDDVGDLSISNFSETKWNFQSIGEGMFSVQTWRGVEVYDEYVDRTIGLYDNISSFVNGLAVVEKEGMFGIISKAGQEIVPITYKNNSYKTEKGEKVEQFEVLNGVVVAVGDDTIDIYSKHGEKLYAIDKNVYETYSFNVSFSRRFIKYLSRIESLRDIYNDLDKSLNNYNEAIKNRLNNRIDTSIKNLILSLGSVKKYEHFINELKKVNGRQNDQIYNKVQENKYKERLLDEIESWKDVDLC